MTGVIMTDRNNGKRRRCRTLLIIGAAVTACVVICLIVLSSMGIFSIIERADSGIDYYATAYDDSYKAGYFSGTGFCVAFSRGGKVMCQSVYDGATYKGMEWSDDGMRIAIGYEKDGILRVDVQERAGSGMMGLDIDSALETAVPGYGAMDAAYREWSDDGDTLTLTLTDSTGVERICTYDAVNGTVR